jgi:signal transduction histidine kinase/ActR/RegA family two-component response regulator
MQQYMLCFLLVLWAPFTASAQDSSDAPPGAAILIYGSGGAANWEHSFNESLRDQLGVELGQYFTPEFLNLILASEEEQALIAESLALKYRNKKIFLIVAVLSEANTFVRDYGAVFAPNAAILRVLPDEEFVKSLHPDSNAIVLNSALEPAIAGTSALLPEFFPDLEHIYLIGGAGDGDREFLRRYQAILARLDLPYTFHPTVGLSPNELIAELSRAPDNSAVMTTTYDIDAYGRPLRSLLLTQQIVNELSLPVIAMADPQVPAGAVGGEVTTVDAYARTARQLIDEILDGDFTPRVVSAETDLLFNGEQLDRFNIDRSLLPANSLIINDNTNIWRDYSQWIMLGVIVIGLQGILIAALLESRRRRSIAEERAARATKMEALGTLAGGVAHDFNNILMSITANAELLSLDASEDSETQGTVRRILSASDRAKHLVSQILMFSRQSASDKLEILDPRDSIRDSIEQIQSSLPQNCELLFTNLDKPALIRCDPAQLHQLLMNLCINAQHAMSNNGKIYARLSTAFIAEPMLELNQTIPPGNYVRIEIEDSGTGIDEREIGRIFEPFYTTKPRGSGTGLGLSLVYQILKTHGGFITVRSRLGEGTTMNVYLPLCDSGLPEPRKKEERHRLYGMKEVIMLVDDDEMVLDSNRKLLQTLNYEVIAFTSSLGALKAFRENPEIYTLVFSDLSMPEMDGVRLVANIREFSPSTPAIIITGYENALHPDDLQGLHILRKPVSSADISQAIHAELAKERKK